MPVNPYGILVVNQEWFFSGVDGKCLPIYVIAVLQNYSEVIVFQNEVLHDWGFVKLCFFKIGKYHKEFIS